MEEFVAAVRSIIAARSIEQLIIGLPLLPSGQEGEQVQIVRAYVAALEPLSLPVSFLDERYTTPTHHADGDAAAAMTILSLFIERRGT
jgi:RNase H-fold protein (predicted Holliday junction resolvase)